MPENSRSDNGKKQHYLGIELLKQGLEQEFGIDYFPEIIGKEEYGKPFLRNGAGFFNISHCNGLVGCAISNIPVGFDVECKRKFQESILKKTCNEAEKEYILKQDCLERFLQIWTLKESYIKMLGQGLRFPLTEVAFQITPWIEKEKEVWKEPKEIQCSQKGYFYQRMLGEYMMSVCTGEKAGRPCLYEAFEVKE